MKTYRCASRIDTSRRTATPLACREKLWHHRCMKTQTAIKLAGSKLALARILGINRQAIQSWSEMVPPLRVYQLKELRPEWFKSAR